ncbi:MAG TPA: type II CAAX endopeptidase family protein [bacterium]|nr:type II CAAX endopeptidase family protein [bacterium]
MTGRQGVNWASVAVFLVFAFGFSWFIGAAMYVLDLPWWTYVAASWGPGIAAIVVRLMWREGFADSGLFRFGAGRAAIAAYAVALFLVPFAALLSTAVGVSAGAFLVRLDGDGGLSSPNHIVQAVTANFGLAGLLLSFILLPLIPLVELGEELGWRDYLVPRLLPVGTVPAFLISGATWAVWHLPFNLLLGNNKGAEGFPLFALYTVLFGALLGYLRIRSGSVWPCAILHAAYNYQPWVFIALTAVAPGHSPDGPQQSMAIVEYAVTMFAGVAAIVVALRSSQRAAR